MADLSTIKVSNTNYTIKDSAARAALNGWNIAGTSGKVLHKSGYVTTSASLSSYWVKAATILWGNSTDNTDVTIYLHSAYGNDYGIVGINTRWGANEPYLAHLRLIAGDLTSDNVKLYYTEDSTKPAELWVNLGTKWGCYNLLVLSETGRVGYESGNKVTLEHRNVTAAETPTLNKVASFVNLAAAVKVNDSDKLDGKHLNEVFDSFSRDTNDVLSIGVGGVTKQLPSPSMYRWDPKAILNQYSRCVILSGNATYILTVLCSQINQSNIRIYLVTLSYNNITIFQIGADNFSENSDIKLRGVKLSTTSFAIDILNPYKDSSTADANYYFRCKIIRIGGSGSVNVNDASIGTSPTVDAANVLTETTSTHAKYLANLVFSGTSVSTTETAVNVNMQKDNANVLSMSLPAASTTKAGVMTKADKVKLNSIPSFVEVTQYLSSSKTLPLKGVYLTDGIQARVRVVPYGSTLDDRTLYIATPDVVESNLTVPSEIYMFEGNTSKNGWVYSSTVDGQTDPVAKELFGICYPVID